MNLFKSAVVCVAVFATCGCEQGQPTAPVPLPESATSIGMEFKLIPAGTFTMGDASGWDNETPHEVTLSKPFKMGVHEVTQAQYEQVMGVNPSKFKGADNPVETVSWYDAIAFCRRLSALPTEKAAGNVYRLPTEAEWEYACRAGTTTKFSFGDDDSEFEHYGWYYENSGNKPHQVGSKQPNAWGLYDMHGSVFEWCQDWYGDYPSGSLTNPTGATSGSGVAQAVGKAVDSLRVLRGGCWRYPSENCKSAYRSVFGPSMSTSYMGFRVCLSPSGK